MKTPNAKRILLVIGLLSGLAAVCAAAWSLRQATRPGQVHFERGLDDAAAKQMPQAEQEWLMGIREDPKFPDNFAQLGDLYQATGRHSEAAAQYQAAAWLAPQDATLFQRLAQAEEAGGDAPAALTAAGRAAALRPDDAGMVGDYGVRAAKLNQPQRALSPLTKAHALAPSNADFLIYLVRVEFQLQDMAAVERDLTPYLSQHPENAEACYLMASLLHQKPRAAATLQAAVDYARRAQAGAPGNADASLLLGQVLLDAGQPAQARPAFQQAAALAPGSAAALHGLLTCDTLLGRPAQAAQTKAKLSRVLAQRVRMGHEADLLLANPSDTAAALAMARLREENGEPALAESYYRRAIRHAPQNQTARAALAGFLRRSKHQ